MPSVSVVIPTFNARRWLPGLFAALKRQTPDAPAEIILVDSGSCDGTVEFARQQDGVRVIPIQRFSHGGARNLGIRSSAGEVVVLMTQDAEPADEHWLARLLAPLADTSVAGAYSRQVPRSDASPMERFFLMDRFPDGDLPVRRSHEGSGTPVYPATFFSNVSSAARKETWLRFPFDERLLMSEDQQFARDVLLAGLALVYVPASVVRHSHAYNLRQTFSRYFDSVMAFRQLSGGHTVSRSTQLAGRTAGRELAYLVREAPAHIPYYVLHMLFKGAGVLAGHAAGLLPRRLCARWSMNPAWWRNSGVVPGDKQGGGKS